ncbi:MAG: hypothetical protein V4563_17710 [Pseudomonadota bacterium]
MKEKIGAALSDGNWWLGKDIAAAVGLNTNTGYEIYIYLARLEEEGFIDAKLEEMEPSARRLPRRMYKLATPATN